MLLYNFNPTIVKETNSDPDPLYNPNEITRVKDILDLHKRGISVTRPVNSRSPLEDSREDFVKLSSPNLESDKLFPSIPRVVAQNAHYKSALEERKLNIEHQQELEKLEKLVSDSENSANSDSSASE